MWRGLGPWLACLPVLGAACDGGPAPRTEAVLVADMAAWAPVGVDDAGPFTDVTTTTCTGAGARYEDPVFEVNTDACDGGTFAQPMPHALYDDEYIHFVLWHQQLLAETAAEAYVGIAVGDDIIWEVTVPIPATEQVYKPYVPVGRFVPPGARVSVHVHNHGENSYKFLDFTAGPAAVFPNFEEGR